MKTESWICMICLISVCLGASLLWAETLSWLPNEAFDHPRRSNVVFLHDEHNETAEIDDCAVCHHYYQDNRLVDGESSEDMSCSECHQPVHFSKGISLMAAFHKRCKGCHMTLRQGPVVCGQCHK